MSPKARTGIVWIILALVSGGYVYLTLTAPPQPTAPGFELYEPWKTVVRITFILPFLLSWAFGAFAVEYLLTAGWQSGDRERGMLFRRMSYGVLALVLGSWLSSLISQLRTNFVSRDSSLEATATIVQNYAYVVFPLVAFIFIYLASKKRGTAQEERNWAPALLLIAVLGALWLAIIFTNESRQVASLPLTRPSYYLSDPLIVLTIVMPTLVAWLLGIAGALNFASLESGGSGDERRSFSRIVNGLLLAVFNSMILNGLLAAGSGRLLLAGLGPLLFIVYVFVFLAMFSYWMMARGARGLITPEL